MELLIFTSVGTPRGQGIIRVIVVVLFVVVIVVIVFVFLFFCKGALFRGKGGPPVLE